MTSYWTATGQTALFIAAARGHAGIVQQLLKVPDTNVNQGGNSALSNVGMDISLVYSVYKVPG